MTDVLTPREQQIRATCVDWPGPWRVVASADIRWLLAQLFRTRRQLQAERRARAALEAERPTPQPLHWPRDFGQTTATTNDQVAAVRPKEQP